MDLLFQIERAVNLKDDLTWTRGELGGSLIVMGSAVKPETRECPNAREQGFESQRVVNAFSEEVKFLVSDNATH